MKCLECWTSTILKLQKNFYVVKWKRIGRKKLQTIILKYTLSIASEVKQNKQKKKHLEPEKNQLDKIRFICILNLSASDKVIYNNRNHKAGRIILLASLREKWLWVNLHPIHSPCLAKLLLVASRLTILYHTLRQNNLF